MTVAYADLFDAPITVDEAARTCVGARLDAAEVRRRAAAAPLADLLSLDADGHLTLRGREALVARRADGDRRTAALLETHERVIAWLASLPFVRMLALSGGTAHRNARGGDDIDLFVVARAGRAYTAYTMLFLASTITRRRGIVCPNYLVDEDNLRIAYHHDLFTAHQAVSLVPIAGLETFAEFVRRQPRLGARLLSVVPARVRRARCLRRCGCSGWPNACCRGRRATSSNGCCRPAGASISGAGRRTRRGPTWCWTPAS